MQKWEYNAMPIGPKLGAKEARETLNERGEEGWEVVAVLKSDPFDLVILKRPKQ